MYLFLIHGVLVASLFLSFTNFVSHPVASNADGSRLIGIWYNTDKTGKILIEQRNGQFFGKIVWLDEPLDERGQPKTDIENPDKAKQQVPLIGLEVLKDFTYEGNNIYSGGKIYDPENGKTYKCKMTLKGANFEALDVRGYIGLPALGRTENWTRAD